MLSVCTHLWEQKCTLRKRTFLKRQWWFCLLPPSFSSLNGKHWTQMPNHGRFSSRSSIWLPGKPSRRVVWGALQLSLGLSRGSDTMASLAGTSRQLPAPFGSPLILRTSSLIFISYWTYFSPHCPLESQDKTDVSLLFAWQVLLQASVFWTREKSGAI